MVSVTIVSIFAQLILTNIVHVDNPSFINVLDGKLLVSTFNNWSGNIVEIEYDRTSNNFKQKSIKGSKMILWPNEITITTGNRSALVGSGFTPIHRRYGAIWEIQNGKAERITNVKLGWFYHRALEFDVNGDGILDIVSCRTYIPIFGGKVLSKLVYFDGLMNMFGSYHEQEIADGCDVNFIIEDLDKDGKFEILYAGLFSKSLSILTSSTGRFDDPNNIKTIVISNTIGSVFDLIWTDLNNDGQSELLVSNHQDKQNGKVMIYVPNRVGNLNEWTWEQKNILVNIPVRIKGKFQASPGNAIVLHEKNEQGHPYIAVSGDGSMDAYLLRPLDNSYQYSPYAFTNCTSTVGEIRQVVLDEVRFVVVPCHDKNELRFFKFEK